MHPLLRRRASLYKLGQSLIPEALVNLDPTGIVGSPNPTEWTNSGTGGAAYDMDVIVGTGANLRIHPTGTYLGYSAAADYASTPDSAAVSITGDFKFVIKIEKIQSNSFGLVGKDDGGNQRAFALRLNGLASTLQFFWWPTGASASEVSATSTANVAFTADNNYWVKVEFVPNDGGGGRICRFYTSTSATNDPESVSWTQLGADVTGANTTLFDSTSPLKVGSGINLQSPINALCRRAVLYTGINTTYAADFNPLNYVSGTTFVSGTTGETWTLNGNSFIQNTGNTVIHSIGSAGLESTAGQTINNPGTVFCVARFSNANPATDTHMFDSRSDPDARWMVRTVTALADRFNFFQGTATVAIAEAYDINPHIFTCQFNGDATSKMTVSGVGNVTGDGGPDNLDYGSLFMQYNGSQTMEGYMAQFLIFDRALTPTEIAAIQSFLAIKFAL